MSAEVLVEKRCPLVEGDRVDHRKFGLGTVVGVSDHRSNTGEWRVDVDWDDKERNPCSVVSSFLGVVSRPNLRPFVYYDKQWKPLKANWLAARRNLENAVETFRPEPSPAGLIELQEIERLAWAELERFIEDDRTGRHP
jgi:hypothetical protein